MPTHVPPRAGRREWVGLLVLSLPTILLGLDMTMLHLAVPRLSAALGPSSSQMLWIVDIYGFLVAGFLITMGTLGDRIGRRRLLLIGGAAFAAASVLAAYAGSTGMLIAARAILGIAGATLMPSTLSLISNMFRDPGQRRFAIAAWMTNFMIGGMIGPLVGGALLERFWWGSVFLLAVPILMVLLVAAPFLLPEYREPRAGRLDLTSAALSIVAIVLVVYGVKEMARDGVQGPALLAVVAGSALGGVFAHRQLSLADPLLDLRLFARPAFSVSLGAQTMGLFVLAGTQFLILQYFQSVLGLSPLQAGLWALPAMVAGIAGTLLAPLLVRWLRPAPVMGAALTVAAVGLALLTRVETDAGLAPAAAGFAIASFGIQMVLALTYDMIISSAPPERAGVASGIGETASELGLALGVAVTGSAATAIYRAQVTDGALPAGVPAGLAGAARDTLGNAVAAAERLPGPVGAELLDVTTEAFTAGVRWTAVLNAVIVAALAATTVILLRHVPSGSQPDTETAPDIDLSVEPEDDAALVELDRPG